MGIPLAHDDGVALRFVCVVPDYIAGRHSNISCENHRSSGKELTVRRLSGRYKIGQRIRSPHHDERAVGMMCGQVGLDCMNLLHVRLASTRDLKGKLLYPGIFASRRRKQPPSHPFRRSFTEHAFSSLGTNEQAV